MEQFFVSPGCSICVMDFGRVGELTYDAKAYTYVYQCYCHGSRRYRDELFRMNCCAFRCRRESLERGLEHSLQKLCRFCRSRKCVFRTSCRISQALTRYSLTLSPDFWMLGKTLVMMKHWFLPIRNRYFCNLWTIVRKLRRENALA
jgi:predicted unusual protein kinase regulating ubiquinone biosynthesis (AarF/ABC1/UbiB family)